MRRDRVKGLLTVIFMNVVSWLPFSVACSLGKLIGWLNWKMDTRSAKITRTNLALCFGLTDDKTLQSLTRASLIETGRTLMETPSIWLGDIAKSRSRIVAVRNENLLDEAIAYGKGVIIVLPHLGNWEMFNPYYNHSTPMTALYNPPDNDYVDDLLKQVRNRMSNRVVPTTRSGLKILYKSLGIGEVVTILPDQVPANGDFTPFFGIPAFTDPLVPRLVQKTGAKVICAYVKRKKHKNLYEVVFRSAAPGITSSDLNESIAALNKSIEGCVLDAPEQYQWEYKRFRVSPPGAEKVY